MNRVILKKKDKNFVLYIYLEEKFELMYIYILFIELIVRDFEKWRLEVSSGTIFRRKAGRERERERDWEEGHPSQQLLSALQRAACFQTPSNRFPLVSILIVSSNKF